MSFTDYLVLIGMVEMENTKIGRYEVLDLIGKGGMGSVYKATDPIIERTVAIKVINLDQIESPKAKVAFKKRFFQEARICGRLDHPGILAIYDIGEEDEQPFVATEFVDGSTLSRFLEDASSLSSEKLSNILDQIADALQYAHNESIVHRDIKPQNIMIDSQDRIKILDFGLAKIVESELTHLTRPGEFVGSPSYSCPEQVRGMPVDHRADLFSFAVTAFELISGRRPFSGDNINTVLFKVVSADPDPLVIPKGFPVECRPALEMLFRKALHKDPEQRFQSAKDLAAAFSVILKDRDFSYQVHARTKPYTPEFAHQSTLLLGRTGTEEIATTKPPGTVWAEPPIREKTVAPPQPESSVVSAKVKPWLLAPSVFVLLLVALFVWWTTNNVGPETDPNSVVAEPAVVENQDQIDSAPPTLDPVYQDTEMDGVEQPDLIAEAEPESETPQGPINVPTQPAPVAHIPIPDPAFKAWLISAFDSDGDGGLSQAEAEAVERMDTPGVKTKASGIRDLTGIGYFTNLRELICEFEDLASLPGFPASLRKLNSRGNQLRVLPALPQLSHLDVSQNKLLDLGRLPASLVELKCADNQLSMLASLPAGLNHLDASGNQLTNAPMLPSALTAADISRNPFDTADCAILASFPVTVVYSPNADGQKLDCVGIARDQTRKEKARTQALQSFRSAIEKNDLNAARTSYRTLSESGDPPSELLFSLTRLEGRHILDNPGDPYDSVVLERLNRAASEGDSFSQYCTGVVFLNGIGQEQDHFEAKIWFEKASEQGVVEAWHGLGEVYEASKGVVRDLQKAATYYIKAAELGYARSQFKIGELYRRGDGVDQSHSSAVFWYQKGADQGYAPAQASLAYMYLKNQGVEGGRSERRKHAAFWYCQAAVQGNGEARMRLRDVKKKIGDCAAVIAAGTGN